MDKATWGGVILGLGGVVGGLLLEGGSLSQVLQPTAAIIVLGGTAGAVLIQFPLPVVFSAVRHLAQVFFEPKGVFRERVKALVQYAYRARREGIISLDTELEKIEDPFLKRSLMLAVDGTEPQELRDVMELELQNQADHDERLPQVFESAGGFSPTIGIIGAVMGLIQVMQHLDKLEEVGRGIAVAFVATIYGVGAANLFLLPAAGKLRIRLREAQLLHEMTLEGVASILEGMNPRALETKLQGFLVETKSANNEEAKPAAQPKPVEEQKPAEAAP